MYTLIDCMRSRPYMKVEIVNLATASLRLCCTFPQRRNTFPPALSWVSLVQLVAIFAHFCRFSFALLVMRLTFLARRGWEWEERRGQRGEFGNQEIILYGFGACESCIIGPSGSVNQYWRLVPNWPSKQKGKQKRNENSKQHPNVVAVHDSEPHILTAFVTPVYISVSICLSIAISIAVSVALLWLFYGPNDLHTSGQIIWPLPTRSTHSSSLSAVVAIFKFISLLILSMYYIFLFTLTKFFRKNDWKIKRKFKKLRVELFIFFFCFFSL